MHYLALFGGLLCAWLAVGWLVRSTASTNSKHGSQSDNSRRPHSGCSATKEIASSASVAANAAHSISERASFIVANSTQPEIVAAAVTIKGDTAVILHEVSQISTAVAGVKDIVPFWATLIQWALGAVVAVALVVVLWQTGLGTAIRVAVGWIPKRKQMDADLARQAMSEQDPTTMREYVAARRASDPLFAAAWKEGAK